MLHQGVQLRPRRKATPQVDNLACIHRGGESRSVKLGCCGGVSIASCALHGECVRDKAKWDQVRTAENGTAVKRCDTCKDRNKPAERYTAPDDAVVVTAADEKFMPGAYLMAWTAMRDNAIKIRCYCPDVPACDPWRKRIENLGVECVDWEGPTERHAGWQTWIKPQFVLDALSEFRRAVWIDADCTVGGHLREAVEHDGWFVADHGHYIPKDNFSDPKFAAVFGQPKRAWYQRKGYGTEQEQGCRQMPCAGFFAVGREQLQGVSEWNTRCQMAYADESLRSLCRYYDQNCLQDSLDCDLQDGVLWNNLSGKRNWTLREVVQNARNARVMHYGGHHKPWFDSGFQAELSQL